MAQLVTPKPDACTPSQCACKSTKMHAEYSKYEDGDDRSQVGRQIDASAAVEFVLLCLAEHYEADG